MAESKSNGRNRPYYSPDQVHAVSRLMQLALDMTMPGVCLCQMGAPLLSTFHSGVSVPAKCERCGSRWIINSSDAINRREASHD